MTALVRGSLGFGGAPLGNLYRSLEDDQARRTLEAAWDGGIRYFDTAPHYGLGLSEERFGAFLRAKPRTDFTVSTKVGRLLVPNPRYRPGERDAEGFDVEAETVRRWDCTEAGLRRSLEESLQRLGLASVDIVFLHDPDVYDMAAARREALPALQRMKAEGLCRAVGVGSNSADALAELVAAGELDLIMLAGRYTLLEQPAAARLLPLCEQRGVGVVAAGVFNSGILAQTQVPDHATYNYGPAPTERLDKARRLAAVCAGHGVALPAAAMQYALSHPTIGSLVVGARAPEEIRANVANLAAPIPQALWAELRNQGLIP